MSIRHERGVSIQRRAAIVAGLAAGHTHPHAIDQPYNTIAGLIPICIATAAP